MIISFGYLTKKSFLFLAFPIATLIRLFLTYLTDKEILEEEKEKRCSFILFLNL